MYPLLQSPNNLRFNYYFIASQITAKISSLIYNVCTGEEGMGVKG